MIHLKAIAKLLAVSVVLLTGSPAFATQIARHDAHCHSCEQKAGAPHWTGGDTKHDDWPARLILD